MAVSISSEGKPNMLRLFLIIMTVITIAIPVFANGPRVESTKPGDFYVSTGILQPVLIKHEITESIDRLDLAKKCITDIDIEKPPKDMFPSTDQGRNLRKIFKGQCKIPKELYGWRLLLTPNKSYQLHPKFVQAEVIYENNTDRKIVISIVSEIDEYPDEGGIVIKPKLGYKAKDPITEEVKIGKKYEEGHLEVKDTIYDSGARKFKSKTIYWINSNGERNFLKEFIPYDNDLCSLKSGTIYRIKGEANSLLILSFKNELGGQGSCRNNYELFSLDMKVKKVGEFNYNCIGYH